MTPHRHCDPGLEPGEAIQKRGALGSGLLRDARNDGIGVADALPFTPIELIAADRARGVHRRWRIAAYRDLFGELIVETQWGRVGRGGQMLMRRFEGEAEALRYVRACMARRRGAPGRIGVAYAERNATPGTATLRLVAARRPSRPS